MGSYKAVVHFVSATPPLAHVLSRGVGWKVLVVGFTLENAFILLNKRFWDDNKKTTIPDSLVQNFQKISTCGVRLIPRRFATESSWRSTSHKIPNFEFKNPNNDGSKDGDGDDDGVDDLVVVFDHDDGWSQTSQNPSKMELSPISNPKMVEVRMGMKGGRMVTSLVSNVASNHQNMSEPRYQMIRVYLSKTIAVRIRKNFMNTITSQGNMIEENSNRWLVYTAWHHNSIV
ncbi:hypothetical protein LguiB_013609 [Lonicera macranthoides]